VEIVPRQGESLKKPAVFVVLTRFERKLLTAFESVSYDLSYLNFPTRFLVERGRILIGYSVDLNLFGGI
jgi:hypothetical protein